MRSDKRQSRRCTLAGEADDDGMDGDGADRDARMRKRIPSRSAARRSHSGRSLGTRRTALEAVLSVLSGGQTRERCVEELKFIGYCAMGGRDPAGLRGRQGTEATNQESATGMERKAGGPNGQLRYSIRWNGSMGRASGAIRGQVRDVARWASGKATGYPSVPALEHRSKRQK